MAKTPNVPLSFDSLCEYDQGSIAVIFNEALRRISMDLHDRPALGGAREITFKMAFKPECEDGDLESVKVEASVMMKMPKKEARIRYLAPSREDRGELIFNPDRTRPYNEAAGQNHLEFGNGDDNAE